MLGLSLVLATVGVLGPAGLDRPIALPRPRRRDLLGFGIFTALLIAQFMVGIWKIHSVPRPNNDVWVFHTDSAQALQNRLNPYGLTFPNIYYPEVWVYAPEVVERDRLLFGYPYPPLTLLLTSTGFLLLGDVRFTMLIASTLTGFLIVLLRPDRIGMLIAAVFLCTPSYLFVIEMGWTEPLHAMLLAGTVACAIRAPKLSGVMLGLLIASKQYLPAALLLVPLMYASPGRVIRNVLMALGVALLITLPLALWDWNAFKHSVVTLQLNQPFRKDAMSFLNCWRGGREGWIGPSWVCFVMMAVAMAGCYRRRAGFAAAFALSYFVFFAFNKQAFANYYYLIVAALCIAAAGERLNRTDGSTDKP